MIMEEKEKSMEQKWIKKFKIWFKDPHNKILFFILIALIIFRLYWFFSTLNQPLWWDEADYMDIAKVILGNPNWDIHVVRPVLLPLISTVFMLLGLGEIGTRLFVLFCSIISVPLLYGVGKKLTDKTTAVLAAFILSVFWSFSFYSHRILADVPVAALWLATIYLFFKAYFENKNWKYFALAGFFLGLSFLMKFPSVILVIVFAVYLLTTEKLGVFKKQKNYNLLYLFIYNYSSFFNMGIF